jgi:hypothetical protein
MIVAAIFIFTVVICVVIIMLLLNKCSGNKQAYLDGYNKGFSDAKFLADMEHRRQSELGNLINKQIL